MKVQRFVLGLLVLGLPLLAVLPTTQAVAEDAAAAAPDAATDENSEEAAANDDEAAAQSDVEELENPESGCSDAMKACEEKHKVTKAAGGTKTACAALRGCKKSCRAAKKDSKKEAKEAKKNCKEECKSEKGKERAACKKECRIAMREAKKTARNGRKDCVKTCRSANLTPECKKARGGFLKAGADCVKELASNPDCQKKAADAFKDLGDAFDGG